MLWKGWRAYGDKPLVQDKQTPDFFLLLRKLAPPSPPAVYINNIFLCLFCCFQGNNDLVCEDDRKDPKSKKAFGEYSRKLFVVAANSRRSAS